MMPLVFSVLLLWSLSFNSSPTCCSCLPAGIKETDIVGRLGVKPFSKRGNQVITVKDKLIEVKARCKKGKLIDGSGREIRFLRLTGCWGNPPENYQEILAKQNTELIRLRKRYTVIEMTCNPSGELIQ
jgi:hypothetical protein